jgi:hypothetical protein
LILDIHKGRRADTEQLYPGLHNSKRKGNEMCIQFKPLGDGKYTALIDSTEIAGVTVRRGQPPVIDPMPGRPLNSKERSSLDAFVVLMTPVRRVKHCANLC